MLFPTLFHQQRESVLPEAQARFDGLEFPAADVLRLEYFCRVVAWRRLESLAAALRLEGQQVWKPEVIAERFEWGKSKAIFALAVRTYRLRERVELPMAASYGGCKSWIELEREMDTAGAEAVLSDEEFGQKLRRFEWSLAQTTTVSPEEARRSGSSTDEAILDAIREDREERERRLEI